MMLSEFRLLSETAHLDTPQADPAPLEPVAEISAAGDGGAPSAFLNADSRDTTASNGKTSYTVAEAASQLVRAEPGWSSALGKSYTVTYGFRADAPDSMPDDASGFSRFNSVQINQAELALKAWSDVANITFVRVGSGTSGEEAYSDSASILFANYSSGVEGASAFAFNPGSPSTSSVAGDVWVNSTLSYNLNPTLGNYGGQVLIHETGHAIGLAHPSEYNAGKDVTITYSGDASYYEDSRQYTVMSYFGESNTGGYFGGYYAAAPLLDDVAAAQLEYGANMTTRTGDTVYGFHSTADRPWFSATASNSKIVAAIWDAGGNDTLDFSGYSNTQTIDLREGFFSSVGGLTGNVAVAVGAKIEAAIGGAGADTIHGNGLNNTINGGSGSDSIDGGPSGSNYLRGDDGNDTITGGAGFDDINGNRGNDVAHGGDGQDWVVGGQDQDQLYGDAEFDVVYGNLGADTVDGGAGADWVRGGQGDDVVLGGDGADWLWGDRGNDTVTGGAGADIFHAGVGVGIDRITDFNGAEGDRVDIDPGLTYTVAQVGSDTVITLSSSPSDQVVLVGVAKSSLAADWVFVG